MASLSRVAGGFAIGAAGGIVYHDVTERKWADKGLAGGVHGLIAVNNRAGGHAGGRSAEQLLEELSGYGVPLVCVPLLSDQPDNAARVVARGAGIYVLPNASPEQIGAAIQRDLERSQLFQIVAPVLNERAWPIVLTGRRAEKAEFRGLTDHESEFTTSNRRARPFFHPERHHT